MEKTSQTQTSLSAYNNGWYRPGSKLKLLAWYVAGRLFINTRMLYPNAFKHFILRLFGAKIGRGVVIKPAVNIKYPWFLRIGNDCWIGEKVWIDNLTMVILESDVCLSQGCMLLTGNHDYTRPAFDLITRPITIAKGAWIGARATVCPGVTVGTHAVLTVGSVASKNLEPYGIYQGNPANIVKTRILKP
ncbi:WcaF family extracellular polysaccharide biosynthesis acetyltransferase [Dyadobacter sandarakinus]|uniref:Colanic acid biosynthesis acetyltransferase WcaF n=1 Tax=Dyadobacter sandarakinus TaxID=2747268 RepID=A0ABX7I1R5_9BACT|nr:WcaF family extracellular polysaccharide biosynthesis acetyltransferase [Dyadobacter sandarakinus]QRQ99637.1 colanic acid biosynthesis acetyltransferase WcaF [Dyadobacter sandarakinus]